MALRRITAHVFVGKDFIGNVSIETVISYAGKLSLYCGRPAYPAFGCIPFDQDAGISEHAVCGARICVHIISAHLSIGIWNEQFWNWAQKEILCAYLQDFAFVPNMNVQKHGNYDK